MPVRKYDEAMEYLEGKKIKVLKTIKPICETFGIKDYDYIIEESSLAEYLKINNTKINCSLNSIDAVIDELIGYIFIAKWCRNRSLGAFSTQTKNVITQYWV